MKKIFQTLLSHGCRLLIPALSLILSLPLTGCFTGVEGTKKISLSRREKKALKETPEERFLDNLSASPVSKWEKGKPFMAADNRTLLIFDPEGHPLDPDSAALKGKILKYQGIESRKMPDGTEMAVLVFSLGNSLFRYETGKELSSAPQTLTSSQIPMLIDLKMVSDVKETLVGQKLWTKTPLWYDSQGNRITGRKFVPVTILDVSPGSLEFPLKLKFSDEEGQTAWLMMNFGLTGNESRAFPRIFMLSSLRDRYPQITDANWDLICRGRVAAGMTKTECKLALGNPTDADSGRDYTQTLDIWQYPDGTVLWFQDGILTRYRH